MITRTQTHLAAKQRTRSVWQFSSVPLGEDQNKGSTDPMAPLPATHHHVTWMHISSVAHIFQPRLDVVKLLECDMAAATQAATRWHMWRKQFPTGTPVKSDAEGDAQEDDLEAKFNVQSELSVKGALLLACGQRTTASTKREARSVAASGTACTIPSRLPRSATVRPGTRQCSG